MSLQSYDVKRATTSSITASGYRSLFVLGASVIAAATLLLAAYVRLPRGDLAPSPALDTAQQAR